MAEYLVQGESITEVADAIREQGGTTAPMSFPVGMAEAVRNIQSGGGAVSSVNGKTGDVTLTAGDVGAVPVPATASVGQTVVVKAVDADGKPTEWEAADKLPKSPTDWEPWTTEEQATALTRLGMTKTILDFTYDGDDVDILSIEVPNYRDVFRARMLIFQLSVFLDATSKSWITSALLSYQDEKVVSNSFPITYNAVPSVDANTEITAKSVHIRTDDKGNYLSIGKKWNQYVARNSVTTDTWSSFNRLSNADITNKFVVLLPAIEGGSKYKAGTSITIVGVM